jgi:hypothetical protein
VVGQRVLRRLTSGADPVGESCLNCADENGSSSPPGEKMSGHRKNQPEPASAYGQFWVRPARSFRLALSLVAALLLLLVMPGVSHALVSVSRAEISGNRLKIEGTAAPNRSITVDGVAMATSEGAGRFKVDRTGFTPPADCTVDVNDGSGTAASARLSGCTTSSPPPPSAVALSSLTLSQTTVVGGNSVTGTVTLSAAAPSAGFVVSLSSSNATLARVPASVTVAAGATSASFTVTTAAVNDTQSATITATGGGVSRAVTLTVVPQSVDQRGSVSLALGCVGTCGSGRVTSQPAGVDCTFTRDSTSGACNNVFFPVGTEVRLEARPASGSRFLGWEFEVSCPDAPKVVIQAGVAHICRPVFGLD